MAGVTFIKRSSIPVSVKGKVASGPSVSVSDKGQVSFNSIASKFLESETVALAMDEDTNTLYVFKKSAKQVAKLDPSEFFTLRKAKKGDTYSFAGTNLLRAKTKYNFAESGNQTFTPVMDEAKGVLTVQLPVGSLAKKPSAPRKKKAKAPAAVQAEAGSTQVLPTTDTEELTLDAA